MSSSSFRRGTSLPPTATDMNLSVIASLFVAMSHSYSPVSPVRENKKTARATFNPSLPSLLLQGLPAEELTVDTATAAAVVAAPAEVRRGGGGGGRCS